jgi:hypothetical protein
VRDREAAKRDMALVRADIFEQHIFELCDTTGGIARRKSPIVEAWRRRKADAPAVPKGGTGVKFKFKIPTTVNPSTVDIEVPPNNMKGRKAYAKKDKDPGNPAVVPPQKPHKRLKDINPTGPGPNPNTVLPKAPAPGAPPAAPLSTALLLRPPHAQYPGFRLGAWAPPVSLARDGSYAHIEEAALEPEDALDLARALGARLGLPNTLAGRALARRGGGGNLDRLPSGSQVFPMDPGYEVPRDADLYFADLSVQRRMLQWKDS